MSMPQTGQIQTIAASGGSYANAFRAELRGDGRMAGGVRFDQTLRVADASQSAAAQKSDSAESDPENGFIGFLKSVLDVINPLQHLPVIGTMYRHLTGDEIGPTARVAGGALYGGPIGAALGVVGAAMESTTGKDMGDTMLAMLQGDDAANPQAPLPESVPDGTSAPVMLAAADIVWHSPAPEEAVAAAVSTNQNLNQTYALRAEQTAARRGTESPLSDTPTTLRTRTGGTHGPDGGSLPSATLAYQEKKGMLAPTQTANRTHTGLAEGAGRSTAPDVGERNNAMHPAKATPVLQSQDAPVLNARRADTPEQIAKIQEPARDGAGTDVRGVSSSMASSGAVSSGADSTGTDLSGGRDINVVTAASADRRLVPQQMMAALDKYAALKKSQDAAAATGRLVPTFH